MSRSANVGGTELTYDANGNLTTDQNGNKLIYDAWNRLVMVTDSSDVPIVEYRYDGLGRRVKILTNFDNALQERFGEKWTNRPLSADTRLSDDAVLACADHSRVGNSSGCGTTGGCEPGSAHVRL